MSIFLPLGAKVEGDVTAYYQDAYSHPIPEINMAGKTYSTYVSKFGIPVALPYSWVGALQQIADGDLYQKGKTTEEIEKDRKKRKASAGESTPIEEIRFPITSSFFRLTCDPWTNETFAKLYADGSGISFGVSYTLGLKLTGGINNTDINHLRFATLRNSKTLLKNVSFNNLPLPEDSWIYATIGCSIKQIFFNSTILCKAEVVSGSYTFDCQSLIATELPADQIRPEWRMPLKDFSELFVKTGNPYSLLNPTTPTERYAFDTDTIAVTEYHLDSQDPDPANFEEYFGQLFNSWVTVAHCTQCIDTLYLTAVEEGNMLPEHVALYRNPETETGLADRGYSPISLVFKIDWRWIAVLLTSVILLLLIGLASVILEGMLIAPDVLGYASTLARNSRYLHLPKTAAKPMSGPERVRAIGSVKVMIQDVKPDKDVGKIALGLKHDRAEPLKPGRLYR